MSEPIETIVETKPQVSTYVLLAKAGLWLTSIILGEIAVAGVITLLFLRNQSEATALAGVVVQACQVLAIVSVSVLGWHGYKGEHLFHTLRHWNDVNPPEPKA